MNELLSSPLPTRGRSPLGQLVLARLREFYREPEAIFWVYGFPILIVVALGIAFRNKPVEQVKVDVRAGSSAEAVKQVLEKNERFAVQINDAPTAHTRLRTGKIDLVVIPPNDPKNAKDGYQYVYDPARAESVLAEQMVNNTLQQDAGREDRVRIKEPELLDEPGARYIDFLVPGLLGMSLMGGGLWGVGFVITDMRIRKLLKRFIATPMKRSHFLAGIMISRLVFMVPEVLILLIFSRYVFGVVIQGNVLDVVLLILLGAFTFSGLGLLVASRAKTLETVSGLMNLVMLPMWVLSGIFFSSERFPEAAQPFIQVIPLTPLIDGLRAVMLEGASLGSQLTRIGILAAWGVLTFALALKWFRWK
jgi:ABC-2 type transport system permease protein